eukprot:CAMPEP_0203936754 /NCGR_PEP_ID=MMETSP0359-20131031/74187_1 /ASSEMBLY_ACC=CAM_ASM_000338 /TAXON_ID=268821 /ORGANISM="Scrippsiella Hangoei, Strain SHTV-5" /LENGTH=233 /DNA_ID=CAMNT_0050866759 /DNA_START=48 /DNA_END=749 /DNA_ORIENTATION=-
MSSGPFHVRLARSPAEAQRTCTRARECGAAASAVAVAVAMAWAAAAAAADAAEVLLMRLVLDTLSLLPLLWSLPRSWRRLCGSKRCVKGTDGEMATAAAPEPAPACCAICLEDLCGSGAGACGAEAGEARLPCGHIFHEACARQWLSRSPRCPFRCAAESSVPLMPPSAAREEAVWPAAQPRKDALDFADQAPRRAAAARALAERFGCSDSGGSLRLRRALRELQLQLPLREV